MSRDNCFIGAGVQIGVQARLLCLGLVAVIMNSEGLRQRMNGEGGEDFSPAGRSSS